MVEELSDWLKSSVLGIVLLGATGSIVAIVAARVAAAFVSRILPAPFKFLHDRSLKQAFWVGFASSRMAADPSGKSLVTFVAFHACRLMIALALVNLCAMLLSAILIFHSRVMLTTPTFLLAAAGCASLYWAYYEFEFIYRMYLHHWKSARNDAEKHYKLKVDRSHTAVPAAKVE